MINLNALFHNEVTIRSLDAHGQCVGRQRAKNTLTHAAADVMINALIRSGPSVITHLYARFGDDSSNPGDLNPTDDQLINTVRNDFVTSDDNIRGGLWVPTLTGPVQESTDTDVYLGNRALFLFRLPYNLPSSQVSPAGNFTAGSSYIYALGLAVAVSSGDRTQDIIVSVLNEFNPFPVPPGGQVAIDYPLQLVIEPTVS